MYTMTTIYTMYKVRHMEKTKSVLRHMKLISVSRRLFWMHLQVPEIVQAHIFPHTSLVFPILSTYTGKP
jgi:hypothetical protein